MVDVRRQGPDWPADGFPAVEQPHAVAYISIGADDNGRRACRLIPAGRRQECHALAGPLTGEGCGGLDSGSQILIHGVMLPDPTLQNQALESLILRA